MCFSASASFGAGVVLAVMGVATLKKVQHRRQTMFAFTPLIFSLQQVTEGFVWLAHTDPDYAFLNVYGTYLFLFIANVVWPFWVPYAIWKMEREADRKPAGKILIIIGALVSLYLGYCLLFYPVSSSIDGHHIAYAQAYPKGIGIYFAAMYVIATITPPLLSKIKGMKWLGAAIFLSFLLTALWYSRHVVSVWCFFASLISVAVFAVFYQLDKEKGSAAYVSQP
jgi:hypothetical protein